MKIFIFLIELSIIISVFAAKLKCEYKTDDWFHVGKIYYCDVQDDNIFAKGGPRIKIEKVDSHNNITESKNIEGVNFEYIQNVTIIPKKMESFFPNLKMLRIFHSNLKEIKQNDLKYFTKLTFLYLSENLLEKIDADIFEYNNNLEVIWLQNNKISHIDPYTFSRLYKLQNLDLTFNECNKFAYAYERSDVLKIVRQIENGECINQIANKNDLN